MQATRSEPNAPNASTAASAAAVKRARFAELPKPRHAWAVEWGSRLAGLRTVKALRKVFGWRVRFSLRTLLLLVAGLSAAIGARLKFDENPWQQTWRWTPENGEDVYSAALSKCGERIAVAWPESEDKSRPRGSWFTRVFEGPDCTPSSTETLFAGNPSLSFDVQGHLLLEDQGCWLVDSNENKELLNAGLPGLLRGVSEDSCVGLSVDEYCGWVYSIWDLDSGRKRFELPRCINWLDGPRCTPVGRLGVVLRYVSDTASHQWEKYSAGDPKVQSVELWDLDTGKRIDSFKHDSAVQGAVLSSDASTLLVAGNPAVALWDVPSHAMRTRFETDGDFCWAQLGKAGRQALIVTHARQQTEVIENYYGYKEDVGVRTRLLTTNAAGDGYEISDLDFTKWVPRTPQLLGDGARTLFLDKQGTPTVLDSQTGECLAVLEGIRQDAEEYRGYAIGDEDGTTLLFRDGKGLIKFERVRPEGGERLFWLPEFWLAALFALALPFSLWRDGRMKKA